MKNIFKNLIPYWKTVIAIILLLTVQAFCDLALPQYTSQLIDVGIQDGGIEYILPEKISSKEFKSAQIFMEDGEKEKWQSAYEKKGDYYKLKIKDTKKLQKLDDELLPPIVLTYQLGHVKVDQFKEMLVEAFDTNPQMKPMASRIKDMSMEELSKMLGVDLKPFKGTDKNGKEAEFVDSRALMAKLIEEGKLSSDAIAKSREKMTETIDKIGPKTLRSMGIAYAKDCDEQAGIDVTKIQKSYLWTQGGKMALISVLMLISAIFIAYLAAKVGADVGRHLRVSVFENVISYSNDEMDKFSTASLITRSTNDVQQIQMVTVILLRMVLYAPVIGIGGIYKVAQTGANMGWIIALSVLVIVGVVLLIMAIAMPKFKKMQTMIDNLNRVSREILTGLPVIRAFGREKTEENRFDDANLTLKKVMLFTSRVMIFMMPTMMFIMYVLTVGITWVGAHRIDAGSLQVGSLTAFITYAMLIVMAFMMMAAMSILLPRAGVAANRINEVITTKSDIVDPEDPKHIADPQGKVVFDKVFFRYPGAPDYVLSDISFTAERGKTTAIIGSTGSGKSTMINLIPRFYDVTSGSVSIDGVDVRDLTLEELRDQLGFVPQKAVLFSGTIESNIKYGNDNASQELVEEAASIAQATEFINEKPEGFQAPIAQGGSNVSGGQKQRLAIARAIARQPRILVFDDSFSALDMKTDKLLRKRLDEELTDVTKIIVAQRISTILNADEILVLDEGKLVGRGTHDELLADCSVYQQIARSQLSAAELELSKEVR